MTLLRSKVPEDHQFEQNSNWPILVQAIIIQSKPHRFFLLMTDGTLNESPDLFLLWMFYPSPQAQLWLLGNNHKHVHQHETKDYHIRKQDLPNVSIHFLFIRCEKLKTDLLESNHTVDEAVQRGHFIWVINLSQSDAHRTRCSGWTNESPSELNIKDRDKDSDERL